MSSTRLITEILVNIWVGLSTQTTLWLCHNWSQQVLMYSGTWDTTSSIQDWILIVHFALQLFMNALFLAFSSSDALDVIFFLYILCFSFFSAALAVLYYLIKWALFPVCYCLLYPFVSFVSFYILSCRHLAFFVHFHLIQ